MHYMEAETRDLALEKRFDDIGGEGALWRRLEAACGKLCKPRISLVNQDRIFSRRGLAFSFCSEYIRSA